MNSPLTVAIDGPSGSGKSSVARGVAAARSMAYLDTGAMYRALTVAVLDAGADLSSPEDVAAAARSARLEIGTDPAAERILVDARHVEGRIREPDVTAHVSTVSAVPAVRKLLTAHQQQTIAAAADGIVVEGRDIGTVVAPDAQVKVFLVADPAVRALRRAAQDDARNGARTSEQLARTAVRADLERRDAADSSRAVSPLVAAPDAVTIDATHLTLEEVVARVLALVREAGG